MTNHEKIKNMSAEEFAQFIDTMLEESHAEQCPLWCKCSECGDCLNDIAEWLESEAE